MKKRLIYFGIVALLLVTARHFACDTTIRDPQAIDFLVKNATWWFPDEHRPSMQRVHAAQTRTGRMGGRQEHLYVEFARPKEFEQFIAAATRKLDDQDAKYPPGQAYWKMTRDVQRTGWPPSDEMPRWWPGAGRADVVLFDNRGLQLVVPAGSDHMYLFYFVP